MFVVSMASLEVVSGCDVAKDNTFLLCDKQLGTYIILHNIT